MRALAVFQDKPGWQTAWLKPGFRHVLAAVELPSGYAVVADPIAGGLHFWAGPGDLVYLTDYYRGMGATAVETNASPGGLFYPTRWTCVEAVKRILGIRALSVLTPYQLYKRLT